MFVARDRDGSLYLYGFKPSRREIEGTWFDWDNSSYFNIIELDKSLYPKLTWEDEPISVYLGSSEYSSLVESKRKFDWDKIYEYCRNHCRSYDECNGCCDNVLKMFEICG